LSELKRTPLFELHRELGARMVPFAGWDMPVQYPGGIIAEHRQCRTSAALFDVSHMGQVTLEGPEPAAAIERLVPGNIKGLKPGRARYTVLTGDGGGILDDIIVSNAGDSLFIVVNAGRRDEDIAHLRSRLEPGHEVVEHDDRALLALQGPAAATVIGRLAPQAPALDFMATLETSVGGVVCRVSRLGYTGEDGFEISVGAGHAAKLARTLLAAEEVAPAGLGARDSLRLEAGLALHGHDIDATTSPVEAQLEWTIAKRRREEGGFPGAERILAELRDGPARRLVGLRPEGRVPAREGALIRKDGREVGRVTSGGFGPTVGAPVALGYVEPGLVEAGTAVELVVRGRAVPAAIASLPFVPHRYHR
jgi:aminomethyltransferase